ncbi:hypothetical protein [Aeromicrobium sp. IC_218]|uniref:hypothetical protein n=1 Tax=Aeromicrobium sp. IC_218 TaxID=2545468 RepID=UPI0013F48BF8|nr:hypothetical protein [Aeromicrobium sp. IC_218]
MTTATVRPVRALLALVLALAALAAVPSSASAADVIENRLRPRVEGDIRVGETSVIDTGAWSHSGLTFAFQWYVDGEPVAGATGRTFVPARGTENHLLSATVTASLPTYAPVTVGTENITHINRQYLDWPRNPYTLGTLKVGSTLRVVTGLITKTPTPPSIQWYVDGRRAAGETGTTFVPRPQDVGKRVMVQVSASAPGYEPLTLGNYDRHAPKVAPGTIAVRVRPTVKGTAKVGRTLRVRPGAYGPVPVRLTYQWLVGGKAVAGATRSTFKPRTAHRGQRVSVVVRVRSSGYTTVKVTSRGTTKVR